MRCSEKEEDDVERLLLLCESSDLFDFLLFWCEDKEEDLEEEEDEGEDIYFLFFLNFLS